MQPGLKAGHTWPGTPNQVDVPTWSQAPQPRVRAAGGCGRLVLKGPGDTEGQLAKGDPRDPSSPHAARRGLRECCAPEVRSAQRDSWREGHNIPRGGEDGPEAEPDTD